MMASSCTRMVYINGEDVNAECHADNNTIGSDNGGSMDDVEH